MTVSGVPTPWQPAASPQAFPIRIACVDMGSNAIRFAAAEFADETRFERLANERRPVRLGHGVYLSGRLDAAAMDGAVDALVDFRAMVDDFGIQHFRAVATSAVRESRNGPELIDRIREAAGVELEVIGGSEEARLVQLAVSRRIPLGAGPWLLVDLGGGSVEVSLVDELGTLWSESHTMGSVRLLEELTDAGSDPGRFRRLLEEYISVLKIPSATEYQNIAGYIATGGNIETIAKLAGNRDEDGVSAVAMDSVRLVIEQVARLSYRERVEGLGLREDRADVVLPAALVYERLGDLVGASEIIVPHVGVKEGVLFDMVDGLMRSGDHHDRQARNITASAVALGRKYQFDEAHAVHVSEMALQIFDQTQSLHGLGDADRRILLAGALLHDIGQFVSYKAHHKHTLYLLSHSELPSFNQSEMALIATVGRYHRKSVPMPHHHLFDQMSEVDRERVVKLASIMRLADALDREHVQRVEALSAHVGEKTITLRLTGSEGFLFEGWGLRKKAQLFQRVMDRKVHVEYLRRPVDL